MLIFLQEIGLQLFLWLLQLVDGLMDLFSAMTGIAAVNYHGQQVNLIEFIVGDSAIGTVFWCIFITAVGLTCIFAIAGLIKNMISGNRGAAAVVGKFFLALLGTMAMLAVVILGILIANGSLQLLARIFQVENTTKLSNAIFNACVGDWLNGYSASNIDVTSLTVSQILGGYNAALFGIWPTSWKGNGMVDPNTFLYLPSLIAGIALWRGARDRRAQPRKARVRDRFCLLHDAHRHVNLAARRWGTFQKLAGDSLSLNSSLPMARCSRSISLRSFCRSSMRYASGRRERLRQRHVYHLHDRGRRDAHPRGADVVCKTIRAGG